MHPGAPRYSANGTCRELRTPGWIIGLHRIFRGTLRRNNEARSEELEHGQKRRRYFLPLERTYFSGILQHACTSWIFRSERTRNIPETEHAFAGTSDDSRPFTGRANRLRIIGSG